MNLNKFFKASTKEGIEIVPDWEHCKHIFDPDGGNFLEIHAYDLSKSE